MKNSIIVLDFGSQYTQLIARRVRELGVYAEILPYNTPLNQLQAHQPKGIILSGGPQSVLTADAPTCNTQDLAHIAPLLAICYGMQLVVQQWGGQLKSSHQNEYGLMNLRWQARASSGRATKVHTNTRTSANTNTNTNTNAQSPTGTAMLASQLSQQLSGPVWMSHADSVLQLPESFEVLAHTASSLDTPPLHSKNRPQIQARAQIKNKSQSKSSPHNESSSSKPALDVALPREGVPAMVVGPRVWGVQFHPEVTHTHGGQQLLKAFVCDECGAQQNWSPRVRQHHLTEQVQQKLGERDHILCALSGGVDSSVLAVLLTKALGAQRVHCVFVDTGLLRLNEFNQVLKAYQNLKLNIKGVRAEKKFLNKLVAVVDPEQKRKIIGHTFIDVFLDEAHELEKKYNLAPAGELARHDAGELARLWLAQGTLYPDVIESVSPHGGVSVKIKSHHNVGGLPENLKLPLLEPFNELFKDEVRQLGHELQVPKTIVERHPFPGPGLALRVVGAVSEKNLTLLRQADDIFLRELKKHHLYNKIWQAFCVLLPVQSVGVGGDGRSYEQVLALRAVTSVDGMTADWFEFDADFLRHMSNCITNEVRGINRVVYDVTSKPPGTIEWE